LGLHAIGGAEVIRSLVVPNLKEFEVLLKEEMRGEGSSNGNGIGVGVKKAEAEKVMQAILGVLGSLIEEEGKRDVEMVNGDSMTAVEEMRDRLVDKVGELVGTRIADSGHVQLAKAVLES
jgi:transcription initiation factor TFIID subunit 6